MQSADDVATTLVNLRPGETIKINVRTPSGNAQTFTVTLGQYPGR